MQQEQCSERCSGQGNLSSMQFFNKQQHMAESVCVAAYQVWLLDSDLELLARATPSK